MKYQFRLRGVFSVCRFDEWVHDVNLAYMVVGLWLFKALFHYSAW